MSLAADYTSTPTYIPPYRPMSRSNEIRQENTEWMKMLQRVDLIPYLQAEKNKNEPPQQAPLPPPPPKVDSHIPAPSQNKVTLNQMAVPKPMPSNNLHSIETKAVNPHIVPGPKVQHVPGAKLPLIYPAEMPEKPAPSTPFRPFKDENRTDEYYRRYLQLSGNMAYRYPEPGYPRERQGAMGGTWRHIKEVLGYGGSQVCFVDGLVRLYDHDTKALSSPSKQLPHMRTSMGTPAYAPNRHNVSSYKRTLQQELEKSTYKPWVDPTKQQMPSIYEAPRGSQMATTGQSGKYKGFYSYPSN